jgi:membrane protease YdiL (CAAX protease family)
MPEQARSNSWSRVLVAFAILFVIYQASEGLQTVIAPGNPLGPILMLVAVLVAWPLGRWLGWRGYDAYGLSLTPGWWGILIGGLLLAGLAKLAALALSVAGAGMLALAGSPLLPSFIALALLTTFVPSIAEDILTRGFLLRAIPVRLGGMAYVLASAALYVANHVWRFDWGVTEQIRLFCLGLAYGAAAWRWRSLWGAVALHWGWNLAGLLVGQVFTVEAGSTDAARLLSGGIHLVLLAIVLCLPRRREPSDQP